MPEAIFGSILASLMMSRGELCDCRLAIVDCHWQLAPTRMRDAKTIDCLCVAAVRTAHRQSVAHSGDTESAAANHWLAHSLIARLFSNARCLLESRLDPSRADQLADRDAYRALHSRPSSVVRLVVECSFGRRRRRRIKG